MSEDRITELLEYWFGDAPYTADRIPELQRKWFAGGSEVDRELIKRFLDDVEAAARGELDAWVATPPGRLALILLLDQLPRSIYRGTAGAFAQDPKALGLCLEGIARGDDAALHPLEQLFLLMPMQHAESLDIQVSSVAAFEALAAKAADEATAAALRHSADYAAEHRSIIERFGRFPHRNEVLGRESTPEEREFLASGGARFGQ